MDAELVDNCALDMFSCLDFATMIEEDNLNTHNSVSGRDSVSRTAGCVNRKNIIVADKMNTTATCGRTSEPFWYEQCSFGH